jgi:hypothetical protein
MKDCGKDTNREKEVFISLRPHIPVRGKPYSFEIASIGNQNEVGRICVRGKIPTDEQVCAVSLTSNHSIHFPLWIAVVASCSRRSPANSPPQAVNIEFHSQNRFGEHLNEFWFNYMFPSIQVN